MSVARSFSNLASNPFRVFSICLMEKRSPFWDFISAMAFSISSIWQMGRAGSDQTAQGIAL